MKENQRKEHRFNCNFIQEEGLTEILKKGSLLGMIMFISSLVTLRLAAPEGLETFWSLLLVILLSYLAAGCLLQLIRGFTPQLDSAWFRGAAAVSWCYLLLFFLSFLTWRLPSFVRAMLLTSAAVLLLLMEAEYRYLKKVAKAAGDKKVEMIHMKDLLPLTGYIRGGCSPVGMKKRFPTYIEEMAQLYDTIMVSAGQRGVQVTLSPEDLRSYLQGQFVSLV